MTTTRTFLTSQNYIKKGCEGGEETRKQLGRLLSLLLIFYNLNCLLQAPGAMAMPQDSTVLQ